MTAGIGNQDRIARPRKLATLAVGATLTLGGAGTATAIAADVPVLDRSRQLERSIVTDDSRQRYHAAYEQAERLNVEPALSVAAGAAGTPRLIAGFAALKGEVAEAEAKQKVREIKREQAEPEFGTPDSVGVSQSTLDAIASCESGGSPTIVDASGTYHGKYQFDVGTWASVGGSGLPSAAPEEEQDYRAALLYSQAGSSPWPVCG